MSQADAGLEQARLNRLHRSLTEVSGPEFSAQYYSDTSVGPQLIALVTINGKTQITETSTSALAYQVSPTRLNCAALAAQATSTTTTTSIETSTAVPDLRGEGVTRPPAGPQAD